MTDCIAVLNAGSSSIKFAIHGLEDGPVQFRGQVEAIGVAPALKVHDAAGKTVAEQTWPADGLNHEAATLELVQVIVGLLGREKIAAVGHRVVHGGMHFAAPVRVDDAVLAELDTLVPLAPLHQPHNLAPIRAIAAHAPHLPQVACFDTAFHRTQAHVVQAFGLPRRYYDQGVRRYGFHGLSYEYIASRLPEVAPGIAASRVVVAHLGNGASACAIQKGRSVASTMGFTAVDGLMMGTRCGAIDPGVLIYLMDTEGMDARGLEDLIYRKSGLLGVSGGVSSDMRTLRASDAAEREGGNRTVCPPYRARDRVARRRHGRDRRHRLHRRNRRERRRHAAGGYARLRVAGRRAGRSSQRRRQGTASAPTPRASTCG